MLLYEKVRRIARHVASYRVSLYAANASFYIVLSIFPALVLILSLLPYTSFSKDDLLAAIGSVVPSVLQPLLRYIIDDLNASGSRTVVSLSALVSVWSSSRGVYCIREGLNAICRVRESRSWLLRRVISMGYMVLLIAALLLTLALHIFGQQLALFCAAQQVPILRFIASILQFRGLLLLLLLTALFTAIFHAFPNRRCRLRDVLLGAFAAALGWLIFSALFSWYVHRFANFSRYYGSLSALAFGMLWLYFCLSILFYGQVLNENRKNFGVQPN